MCLNYLIIQDITGILIALIYVYIKKKKEEEKNQNGKSEFPVMVDEKSIVQFSFVQPLVDIYNAWPDV